MKIRENVVYGLIGETYKGNLSQFCKALDLDYTGVWKVLVGQSSGGGKFIPAFFDYCKENNLNFMDYFE